MIARPFSTLLVANRGEIACRIFRAARARGLVTVAVWSDADRNALHVRAADRAVRIGTGPASDSYLRGERIIAAAKETGADAIHPGYGFLAENADFAEAVLGAGLIFVGPPPGAIRAMGDKAAAKKLARKAGVPVVPGYDEADQSDERLVRAAKEIGFPVMVKAAAGGGGRGMRRVARAQDLVAALASARREAEAAFGDGTLLLERALDRARHVEIQILRDASGKGVHLGERDCSLQRRHQKVIEEAPAPGLPPATRASMGKAALKLAQAIGYVNAGTVEFLLDADGTFYFLEMNTRIQVEHPVTELVTGFDIVALQLAVAAGEPLAFGQDAVELRGHAIEARLCAEDPADGFRPQAGRLAFFRTGNVRADSGFETGSFIPSFYDSLLAKLVAFGNTRDEARARLLAGLADTRVLGVRTNRDYLAALLRDSDFAAARLDTGLAGRLELPTAPALDSAHAALAALILEADAGTPYRSNGYARTLVRLSDGRDARMIEVLNGAVGSLRVVSLERLEGGALRADIRDGEAESTAWAAIEGTRIHIDWKGREAVFEDTTYAPAPSREGSDGIVRAPMAGRIASVAVKAGDAVAKGTLIATLEAMKMEHEIRAPLAGTVAEVSARTGDQVAARQLLTRINAESAPTG